MTHDPATATAADYADALMTARRAKNLLVLVILLMLLGQLALFFTAKYSHYIHVDQNAVAPAPGTSLSVTNGGVTVTLPDLTATTQPSESKVNNLLQYAVALTGFLGITFSVVLALVVLLLAIIMLVGRLIGVARVTSAFIWSIVLIVLLFPWQAFLADAHFVSDLKIPGVLYTWAELVRFAKVGVEGNTATTEQLILHWGRFVAFPVITVIITLMIQVKTNRGLKEALGEIEPLSIG
jgi:hypothetical protein